MGRRQNTTLLLDAKEFSVAFATAVTEASENPDHWIAKKGENSIFSVLNDIFPQARSRVIFSPPICISYALYLETNLHKITLVHYGAIKLNRCFRSHFICIIEYYTIYIKK